MTTSFYFYAISFASAFGGVLLAGLLLLAIVRATMKKLVSAKVAEGNHCPLCKQRKKSEPVDRGVLDFFSRLREEQLRSFHDALDESQRYELERLLGRIIDASSVSDTKTRSRHPPPGKDCH